MRKFVGRFVISVGRVGPLTVSARDGARFGRNSDGVLSVAWMPGLSVLYIHKAR